MRRRVSFNSFHPSSACFIKGSSFEGGNASFFKWGAIRDTTTQACSSVRPWTSSRSNSYSLPASHAARSFKWFSVGSLLFLFFFLLLSHLDELEVTLELESEEHADSILRFELVCGKVCIEVCGVGNMSTGASPSLVDAVASQRITTI
jgi:hypothetical protein